MCAPVQLRLNTIVQQYNPDAEQTNRRQSPIKGQPGAAMGGKRNKKEMSLQAVVERARTR